MFEGVILFKAPSSVKWNNMKFTNVSVYFCFVHAEQTGYSFLFLSLNYYFA
jgi:hypothetical protein